MIPIPSKLRQYATALYAFLAFAGIPTFAPAMPEQIADEINFLNKEEDTHLALNGYDPVAYFTAGKARAGSSEFSAQWGEAVWYFSSAENRDSFLKNPDRYVPEFGGLCTWSLHNGKMVPANPECFTIQLDRLYLHFDQKAQKKFENDLIDSVQAANQNWLEMQVEILAMDTKPEKGKQTKK